jgi:hypothetical protein
MWLLLKGTVLTKDNLANHNWQGNKMCLFNLLVICGVCYPIVLV